MPLTRPRSAATLSRKGRGQNSSYPIPRPTAVPNHQQDRAGFAREGFGEPGVFTVHADEGARRDS